jgi:ABC-type multidrug transport system fused ATPase/permease subunit
MFEGMTPTGQRVALAGLILGAIAVRGPIWWGAAVLRSKAACAVHAVTRRRIFERLARAPLSWFQRTSFGEKEALLVHETQRVADSVYFLSQMSMEAVMSAFYGAVLCYLSLGLTAVAFLSLAVVALCLRAFRRPIERYAAAKRAERGQVSGAIHETLSGLHLLRLTGRVEGAVERFEESNRRYVESHRLQQRAVDAIMPLSEVLGAIVVVEILWLGSTLLPIRGEGPSVLLLFYVIVLYRLMPRFLSFLQARAALSATHEAAPAVVAFLEDPSLAPPVEGPAAPPRGPHRIAFEGVRFRYGADGPWILDGFDLVLEPGLTTALIGRSGVGKSTIVDLLLGLRRPTEGRVTVGGTDLATIDGDAWRRQVGVVPQDPMLFDWTVRENLRLVAPQASPERMAAALDVAAAGFVKDLPAGLDTPLGERGVRLSGGERQRICIARAVLEDPALLVFDEATSHLDPEGERAVTAAIGRAARDRTALVIAHRLSTVRQADRIALLSEGRVAELGSHEALVAKGGRYAGLVRLGMDDLEAAPAAHASDA